jgi:thiamine transport system permease protein
MARHQKRHCGCGPSHLPALCIELRRGGAGATTLEVAIYQSLRSDFDPQRAAMLALVQLALCATLALVAQAWGGLGASWPALRLQPKRHDGHSTTARLVDGGIVLLALLLLLPPLAALIGAGVLHINPSALLLQALLTSLGLGAASAALAFAIVWPLAVLAVRSGTWRKIASIAVLTAWIVPPAALATGWFIILIAHAGVSGLAAFLVIAMNALMSLPFVARVLMPALSHSAEAHDRLCISLGLSGWNRFHLVELALMLSLGDLTAISLFGTQGFVTLPALIYRQMGSYRFDEAIGTALVLSALVLAFSTLAERWSDQR